MKIALTNTPPDKGEDIAKTLVEEHLVACVNFYPIQSVYFWKGEACMDKEITLMMKVAADGVEALKKRLLELHPYELPEFVVLEVDTQASLEEYVKWVRHETK
ncbi:MAG TPA: divalent-cation tolerance protein CutA [Thioploca sp.]|nr:MAG: divalent cation tolerance protein [Beggiatoa sp. 4572_84]RKZ58747.1 MAG: divalent-cation tolerance protein CutA [Gammaproteobacteria bacterium]HDN26911.1 divalent-cation tolerance protein CutA [Thioploca sp.]